MKNVNDISEELRSMGSSLADLSRNMPYSVPQGFFDNFEDTLQNTIKELNTPDIMPAWSKTQPFSVPVGYFEELTDNIVSAVTAEELASFLPKDAPFKVPAGYFETLPAHMLRMARAADPAVKETKIIPLKRRNFIKPLRWAAAAILLIGIGFGSYETLFKQQTTSTDKILASVPSDEIHDYLQHTYRLDIDRIVGNNDINNLQIENKDIIQYLNENGWDIVE
jgi:hypothetical protein